MRTVHARCLLVALGAGLFSAGVIAGCGGDDSNGATDDGGLPDTSVGDDGGGGGEGGQQDSGPGAHADANDLSVYVGQLAKLDGSASVPPGATFAWTFDSVPPGSAITTASLLSADSAKPSFTPDVVGDYALKLTVKANGTSDTKTIAVHAVVAKTFFALSQGVYPDGGDIDGGPVLTYNAVPTTGGGAPVPVTCGYQGPTSSAPIYALYAIGLRSADQWEGPAGTEPRALVLGVDELADGGVTTSLLAVTGNSTCGGANAPKVLDAVSAGLPVGGGGSDANMPVFARFSADGARVLYVKSLAGVSASVATIGFDGSNPHAQIVPFNAYPDGGVQDGTGVPYTGKIAPRWAPGGKIALADAIGSGRFMVRLVDDANNATPTLAMGCTGTISHFDALANGDYIVVGQVQFADGGVSASPNLYILHPNAVTKECEIVHDLSNIASGAGVDGFTLSPDQTQVAYVAIDSAVDGGADMEQFAIYVGPVDATTAAARVPGLPFGAGGSQGLKLRPPRWVQGGSALSFELSQHAFDAGASAPASGGAIAVAPVSGGSYKVLRATQNDNEGVLSLTACSIGRGPASSLMAFGSLAAFLGLVVRRRRKS